MALAVIVFVLARWLVDVGAPVYVVLAASLLPLGVPLLGGFRHHWWLALAVVAGALLLFVEIKTTYLNSVLLLDPVSLTIQADYSAGDGQWQISDRMTFTHSSDATDIGGALARAEWQAVPGVSGQFVRSRSLRFLAPGFEPPREFLLPLDSRSG